MSPFMVCQKIIVLTLWWSFALRSSEYVFMRSAAGGFWKVWLTVGYGAPAVSGTVD
jgi:hypothetical protein